MYGKEGTSNESDRNLVQGFTVEQIQQLAKVFTHSAVTVKVTRLLALQVCLPITRL